MEKRKILFITWSYTSGGGAEKILNTISKQLIKYGYQIDILEYWHDNHNQVIIEDSIKLLEPIVDSRKDNIIIRVIKKVLVYFFPSLLRKKYAKDNYDIEISFNYMIPTFLLRKNSKKIAWIHGDIYELSHQKFNYFIQKKYLKRVDKIVAISNNTYESIISVYPFYKDKTIIINNSYDFDTIIQKSNEYLVEDFKNSKVLLFLGRFDENKNPLFLIDVLEKVKYDNIILLYIGEGNLKEKMGQVIINNNISNKVKIIEYQKNPYPYIKRADILLCSSHSEGFPTVLVEGMVLGKPFVSTEVGGTIELSNENKCGFVTNEIDEYAEKINNLLFDKNLYDNMSKNCYEYIKKYSLNCQIENINNLFNNL